MPKKISDWLPTAEELERLRSIESSLLRRRSRGNVAGLFALLVAAIQIVAVIMEKGYGKELAKIASSLLTLRFDRLIFLFQSHKVAAVSWILLLIPATAYLLLRRTGFLLREAKEPFKYTFWIQPFSFAKDTPGEGRCKLAGGERFAELHHDLMERLVRRIGRFSVLNEAAQGEKSGSKTPESSIRQSYSHIHIDGDIALRQREDGTWGIHLIPQIRIGSEGSPSTLGHPIFFPLVLNKKLPGATEFKATLEAQSAKPAIELDLDARHYTQIVERVYSSVATEIYRRIDSDVREKIRLFPTARLQILALYREAEDFARSNTVDAYDRAIEFYRQALRHYERIEIKPLGRWILKFPWLFWRIRIRFERDRARVVAGYAKCMVFRRELSTQSGRSRNPLYALPRLLEESIQNLVQLQRHIGEFSFQGGNVRDAGMEPSETRLGRLVSYVRYPLDKWYTPLILSPGERAFDIQRKVLFSLYLADALVQRGLNCNERALKSLEDAAATAPDMTNEDSLFVLVKGLTEPVVEKAIVHFRQAAELAPNFQMAQWYLAKTLERVFREFGELRLETAQPVLKAYEAVNALNYGNIGALYSRGYLLWLIGDLEAGRECMEEGRQVKVVATETFTGELSYGLARIAAETGRFEECRTLYLEAITSEPALGTVFPGRTSRAFDTEFENMGNSMLERYEKYRERVAGLIHAYQKRKTSPGESKTLLSVSEQTLKIVQGFVLNDYGNARLRHFHQHGDQSSLEEAIVAYSQAEEMNPQDARPTFNLQNAYSWSGEYNKADECFERAGQLSPGWTSLVISAAVERVWRYARTLRREEDRWRKILGKRYMAASQGRKDEEKWLKLDLDESEKLVKEWKGKVSEAKEMAFQRIRESFRFAGILASEGVGIQEKVRYLAAIPWRKLEERDVELQIRMAELLAIRPKAQELISAEVLWSSLIEMLREDYDIVSGLRQTARQICNARAAFAVIKDTVIKHGYVRVTGEIQKFVLRNWTELKEHEVDLLIQLSDLFHPKNQLDRGAATALLAHLFAIETPAAEKEVERGVAAWETQSSALRNSVSKIVYPEFAHSRLLFRLAEKQYRKILLGWLRNETGTFLAHWWASEFNERAKSRVNRQAEEIKRQFFGDGWSDLRREIEGWVHFRKGDFKKAKESFLDLINHNPEDPGYLYFLGLCRERSEDLHGAVNAFQRACRLAPDKSLYRKGLGSAYNRLGDDAWKARAYADAADKYGEAVAQVPDEHLYHYKLAHALELAKLPDSQGAVEKAREAMRQAHRLDPTNADYQGELRRIETLRNAYACYGPVRFMKWPATVTPLTVEYGVGLKSFIQDRGGSKTGSDLDQRYEELRDRIDSQFGVKIPKAEWMARDELPAGSYALMFYERLVVWGEVRPESRFCLNPPAELFKKRYPEFWRTDIPRDPITGKQTGPPLFSPARDPLTGAEGAWIGTGAFDSGMLGKLQLFDALDFVLRHLEAVVLSKLQDFLSHQEVINRLRGSRRSHVRRIAESPEQVDALVDVLKAKLCKQEPIEPFDDLCLDFLFMTR